MVLNKTTSDLAVRLLVVVVSKVIIAAYHATRLVFPPLVLPFGLQLSKSPCGSHPCVVLLSLQFGLSSDMFTFPVRIVCCYRRSSPPSNMSSSRTPPSVETGVL